MKILFALLILTALLASTPLAADSTDQVTAADSVASDTSAVISGATVLDEDSESLYPMSPERYEKLVSYSKFNHIWRFVSFLIGLLILGVILFTGLSAKLRDWTARIKWKFVAMWAFLILFLLADYVLTLPFAIYRGFVVESNYGFMNQTFMQWWGDDMLNLLITGVLMIIPVWFFYWMVNKFRRWWLWFSIGAIPFVVLLVVVAPVVISPLFNEFGPLQDKQLETEILALADQAGIESADVFQVDASRQSTKINAYVTGLFGTKRIVLYDTLIDNFTLDEIKFVMAHEMGHYVMNHVWQGVALTILFILLAMWLVNRLIHPFIDRFKQRFGFDRLGDCASWPLVLGFLVVVVFIFQPVTNTYGRYMEHQSDIYGMEMSGVDGETGAIFFDKLSVYNLSDPDPHPVIEFWFYTHPSLKKRMEFVRGWGK